MDRITDIEKRLDEAARAYAEKEYGPENTLDQDVEGRFFEHDVETAKHFTRYGIEWVIEWIDADTQEMNELVTETGLRERRQWAEQIREKFAPILEKK